MLVVEKQMIRGLQTEIFKGRGGFIKSGHIDKYFIKKALEKMAPQGKTWRFFS